MPKRIAVEIDCRSSFDQPNLQSQNDCMFIVCFIVLVVEILEFLGRIRYYWKFLENVFPMAYYTPPKV